MESTILKFLTSFIGAKYYHLLTDVDRLISSLKDTSQKIKDPFYNRSKIWEDIEGDVDRVKANGKPVTKWMEEWVSNEFDDKAVLLQTIELVTELKDLGVEDEELGLDEEDHGVYDVKPGDYDSEDDFVTRKVNELYKIRRKIALRLGFFLVSVAGGIVGLVFIAQLLLS